VEGGEARGNEGRQGELEGRGGERRGGEVGGRGGEGKGGERLKPPMIY